MRTAARPSYGHTFTELSSTQVQALAEKALAHLTRCTEEDLGAEVEKWRQEHAPSPWTLRWCRFWGLPEPRMMDEALADLQAQTWEHLRLTLIRNRWENEMAALRAIRDLAARQARGGGPGAPMQVSALDWTLLRYGE